MSTKQFHLLGEEPATTSQSVELPPSLDEQGLQQLVASYFAIVDPNGVGFVSQHDVLTSVAEVMAAEGRIAITIEGKAVREVPGPAGLPWFGNYFEVYPDHLGNHQRLFEKYGPLFKTNNMGSTIYHTNDPSLATIAFSESDFFSKRIIEGHPLYPMKNVEAGLFLGDTSTQEWRDAHKFLPPALGPKAVRHYAPAMQKTVEDAFKVFDELDGRDEAWNVYPYMLKLASQAVCKLVLGMDCKHFAAVDAPLHEMPINLSKGLELNKQITAMGSWYRHLPFGAPRRLRNIRDRTKAMMYESIANASRGSGDLELQEAALEAENMVDYVLRACDSKGNKLPPERLMEPLVVATAAGFTTTSALLSWLTYGLVMYSGMQQRLLQELVDHDFDSDTQMTAELTNKLTFLDKYIKETQRKHNPAYQTARTAAVDMILPGGYKLPKDAVVIPALHHIHNNPNVWDNHTLFDPDRWDTERVKNRPHASFIPFATGPRGCIGFNFALQEIKIFLAKLVYRYKFSLAKDDPVEYDPMFQLIQPNNLYVRAEKRVKWPPKTELQA